LVHGPSKKSTDAEGRGVGWPHVPKKWRTRQTGEGKEARGRKENKNKQRKKAQPKAHCYQESEKKCGNRREGFWSREGQ